MSEPTPRTAVGHPEPSEYDAFYANYIAEIPEGEILDVLERQAEAFGRLAEDVPPEKESFRYAPGKWSVRQVVGHLADCERSFAFRALAISRGDRQPLPGLDETLYMANARFDDIPLTGLVDNLLAVRQASLHLFRHLDDEAWKRSGIANGKPVSVRALAHIAAGHAEHHLKILRERYGV